MGVDRGLRGARRRPGRRLRPVLLLLPALLFGPPLRAAEPDTQQIIEALMPPAERTTRNLLVRQRLPDAASASASPPTSASSSTAQAAPASSAQPEPVDAGAPPSLSLTIEFELNSPHVRPVSGPLLARLVAAMQSPQLRTSRFLIEGHTDASGPSALNQRLSQARADEVREYLIALGVPAARLRSVGKGASELADPLDPQAATNRRVRVVTLP